MLVYAALLNQEYGLPVVPVLVLSYDKPRKVCGQEYIIEVRGREYLRLNWHVVQLNRLDWREYVKRPNPAAAALMAKMGIRPEDRVRVKLEITRLIATFQLDTKKMEIISGFVETYLSLTAREEREYRPGGHHIMEMPNNIIGIMKMNIRR